jgi:hypothetical protein
MCDLDPCLRGCDSALAEADLLIAMLSAIPESARPEMAALRGRIALLRHEVGRLRGQPLPWSARRFDHGNALDAHGLPWPLGSGPANDS